nr:uncharacterized protein LOC129381035 [Dermacentor andersoni]
MDPELEERLRRMSEKMSFDPYSDTSFRNPLHADDGSNDSPPLDSPNPPDGPDDDNDHRCFDPENADANGFRHEEDNAPLPPGAAWSSFPSGRAHNWSATNSGVAGATRTDGAVVTASEQDDCHQWIRQRSRRRGVVTGSHGGKQDGAAAAELCGEDGERHPPPKCYANEGLRTGNYSQGASEQPMDTMPIGMAVTTSASNETAQWNTVNHVRHL